MILTTVKSINNVPIRLTDERWSHITTSHLEIDFKDYFEIMVVVEKPDRVLKGDTGELLAVKKNPGKERWLVVAYKEVSQEDGFILTAYFTTAGQWLFRRETLWNNE